MQAPVPDAILLDPHGVLSYIGMGVSERIGNVVCLQAACRCVVLPQHIYGHLQHNHPHPPPPNYDPAELEQALAHFGTGVSHVLPDVRRDPRFLHDPIVFAALQPPIRGFRCTSCMHVASRISTLHNTRSGCPSRGCHTQAEGVSVQRLNQRSPWFAVCTFSGKQGGTPVQRSDVEKLAEDIERAINANYELLVRTQGSF
ncbi:hypothetical protein PENSPDRAFT_690299 [Peniophora sp. CONT]|nr:hypothetical protein PENSPDRAFT_690299 [Peniophora sp. CONT]